MSEVHDDRWELRRKIHEQEYSRDELEGYLAGRIALEKRVDEAIAYTHRNGHSGVNLETGRALAEVRRILEGK